MTDAALQGVGVLVTRPRAQSAELIAAMEKEGANVVCFPVIEIVPRDEQAVQADVAKLPDPDIVIFVSRNAVQYGTHYARSAKIAAIGPATEAAILATGHDVDICPRDGYDSESLLEEPALNDVSGKQILIIRGDTGRELLAETLAARGATVNYLCVYNRQLPRADPDLGTAVEARWRNGEISIITVMSVQTLNNLLALLPDWCVAQLENTPLVTPAARVIKVALDRRPASRTVLASGPGAEQMVQAIIETLRTDHGLAP
jgi:uroporphyrinogen-III synthase